MNWSTVGKAAEILSGYAFDSKGFNQSKQGLPIVRIRDVVRGYSDTYYMGDYPSQFVVDNGDVLIGMDGEFNIHQWKGGKALLNQRVCKVTPKVGIAELGFLRYALGPVLRKIEDKTPFVTVKHLSSEELKASEIPLPPLDEQKRIAAMLERADHLRRTHRFARTMSDTFLQSVFLQMFGDPVSNPMGWEVEELESACSKIIDYRGRTPTYSESGIKHITSSCIKESSIDWSKCKHVSEETFRVYMTRGLPERNDVVFTTEAPMGETAVVNVDWKFSLAQRLVLLRGNLTKLDGHYLSNLLSHPLFFPLLNQYATGSTVKGISSESLKQIPVMLPPLEKQQQFAAIVQKYERMRAGQIEAERQAEHLFQTLLHRAFATS